MLIGKRGNIIVTSFNIFKFIHAATGPDNDFTIRNNLLVF